MERRIRSSLFFVYDLTNTRTEHTVQLVTQVIYECKITGLVEDLKKIESVVFPGKEYDDLIYADFGMADVSNYVSGPYLFSVNNYRQYIEVMERLGHIFRDRALAGYFFSEFNRSCRSVNRKEAICMDHSYRP